MRSNRRPFAMMMLWSSQCLLLLLLLLLCLAPASHVRAQSSFYSSDFVKVDDSTQVTWVRTPFPKPVIDVDPAAGKVLVLGSGGLIGRHVVQWLEHHGYKVLHVKNRQELDLRKPGALDVFDEEEISFCIFLACEVGGSKYIENSSRNVAQEIIESNLEIYQVVFPWLQKRQIRFIFTSSYLQSRTNGYGTIKRLGEAWINTMNGQGRSIRLWNIYGFEKQGMRSHVLTDWITSCVNNKRFHGLTDGKESRQFLHAADTAAAIGTMMTMYSDLHEVSDVSSSKWTTLQELARLISEVAEEKLGHPCPATFSSVTAQVTQFWDPVNDSKFHETWHPRIQLKEGIAELMRHAVAENVDRQAAEGHSHEDL